MSTSHTQGGWGVMKMGEAIVIVSDSRASHICLMNIGDKPAKEVAANTSLVIAAPELLKEIKSQIDRNYNPFEPDNQSDNYKRLVALYEKATGAA